MILKKVHLIIIIVLINNNNNNTFTAVEPAALNRNHFKCFNHHKQPCKEKIV